MSTGLAVWTGQGREDAQGDAFGQPEGSGRDGCSELTPSQRQLRAMVLASVTSTHSRRNYAKALDLLFAFAEGRPLTRALLMGYRASMDALAPSTVNVRLAAIRKLVTEARKNGMLSAEDAANLTEVPNVAQKGTRLGNWLTKEQARELLAVPDRSTLKRKRDYALLALLVGCALRRRELASLSIEDLQMRENRWVIADLRGKGGRIRTVAVPVWVKNGINAWQTAAKIDEGPLLRSITRGGKVRESLSDWAIWAVVTAAAKEIGIERSVLMTCDGRVRSSAGRPAATSSRSNSCSGIAPSRPPNGIWDPSRTSLWPSMTVWGFERCALLYYEGVAERMVRSLDGILGVCIYLPERYNGLAMSEHVIQNPVPTPEQMAEMLGVSPERVTTLRGIMKAPSKGSFAQRGRSTGVIAMKTTSVHRKAIVVGKGKDTTRAKTKAR